MFPKVFFLREKSSSLSKDKGKFEGGGKEKLH
jgi:hypothetical protein